MANGRLLQPKSADHQPGSSASDDVSAEQKSSSFKRKCVPTACIPCRRRKSKCDGGVPICSTCIAVYKTECSYEKDVEARSRPTLKRNSSSISDYSSSGTSDVLINHLRTLSEAEAAELFSKIRKEDQLDSLVESLRQTATILPSRPGSSSVETESTSPSSHKRGSLSSPKRLRLPELGSETQTDVVDVLQPMSSTAVSLVRQNGSWTRVTNDTSFVRHLLRLYFTWQHPFHPLFSEELFYQDMELSRDSYCSSLLVNAICAYASSFSDMPLRRDTNDSKSTGDLFFEEASALLFDDGSSRLTTVQALAIMGLREASCARESVAFQYIGRSVRMAVDLGLHLPVEQNTMQLLSDEHSEAHRVTFWGCFALDNAWALFAGRLPQLPLAAIGAEKPFDQGLTTSWVPYNDMCMQQPISDPTIASYRNPRQLFQTFCSLSEIVNDTLFFYHAPREQLTARRVLDRYAKYRTWFKSLPPNLIAAKDSSPQVYLLHMFYHTCVIHLFRPLILFNFANSPISPREVCVASADRISEIMVNYRQLFGLRRGNLILANILQSACTVHLLDLPSSHVHREEGTRLNSRAQQNLARDIQCLVDISANHAMASQSIRILSALLEKSGLETCLASLHLEPIWPAANRQLRFLSPASSDSGTSSKGLDSRSHASPRGERFRSPDLRPPQQPQLPPVPPLNPIPPVSSTQSNSNIAESGASYFWTPFPGQGIPLMISRTRKDPMALATMLENVGLLGQLRNDGFIFNAVTDVEMTAV